MVEIASRKPVVIFKMMDGDGRTIGRIVQPKTSPVVGLGARTVLLVRGEQVGERVVGR